MCGVFARSNGVLTYAGGTEYVQYIEREKLCFTLIKEYIKDLIMMETEVFVKDMEVKIHWLFPGKSLDDGLALLYDDASIKRMDDAMTDGCIAEVYAEQIEDDVILDDQHINDVYSKHRGTRFPLIDVEVIDTDKSMAILCDGVTSLHVSPVSNCKKPEVVVTQSPQEKDTDLEKFREIFGYSQHKSKKTTTAC